MNKILSLLLIGLMCSCSFKSSKDEESVKLTDELNVEDLANKDSDGDRITDKEEVDLGLDRFVADIPKIKANFLQNYKIKATFEDESEFVLDTKVARDNPDFSYRVGELFIKKNSLKNAARIGRFSGVSWGEISQKDISWMQYPDISKEFYFSKVREYDLLAKKVKTISLSLENNLKLLDSQLYNEIKDVEVNFYYYSYSKSDYVLLHTQKLDQVFQSGVRETFELEIDNVPTDLLEDTYLRHGEFIISEIKDFFIPKINMKYSELLKSVKSKTVAVYKSNPIGYDLNYVATRSSGDSFIDITKRLYGKNIEVLDQKLSTLEQFSNNLESFGNLNELKGKNKNGQWFVMTKRLKTDYLSHLYQRGETISLCYITGDELSSQKEEQVFSKTIDGYSDKKGQIYPLGNIGQNSEAEFSLYLKSEKGTLLSQLQTKFSFRPRSCRNCTGTNWSVWADYNVNTFKDFEKELRVNTLSDIESSVEVYINNTKLNLKELYEQNLLTLELKDSSGEQYLHYKLHGLDKLEAYVVGNENVLQIKLLPIKSGEIAEGVQITKMGGHNVNIPNNAGAITYQMATKHKTKLAVTGLHYDHWNRLVNWGGKDPNGFVSERGLVQEYWHGIVLDIVSNITNNYN